MALLKSKRSFYRTRTAYSINRTIQPVVSKVLLDVQTDQEELRNKTSTQRKFLNQQDTVLDRIIGKLKNDNKNQDILLLITPTSRHPHLFKLHVIQRHQQSHLGMITVTEAELSHLKISKAFQNNNIVFASRYINFVKNEKIRNVINCLDKILSPSKESVLSQDISIDLSKSKTSSAGDYFKNGALKTAKYQSCFVQTESDEYENTSFSLNDIYTLIETINRTLQPSQKDINRFFYMAEQLNFSLVVRPQLLWKTAEIVEVKNGNDANLLVESYLPGSCYLGCISLKDNDLQQIFDLYPKLLLNTHVIEDVFEITPLPKKCVMALKNVLVFLGLELLYDAVGECLFNSCKDFTYL